MQFSHGLICPKTKNHKIHLSFYSTWDILLWWKLKQCDSVQLNFLEQKRIGCISKAHLRGDPRKSEYFHDLWLRTPQLVQLIGMKVKHKLHLAINYDIIITAHDWLEVYLSTKVSTLDLQKSVFWNKFPFYCYRQRNK